MKHFYEIRTETELKARYKELAKEHHPDKGGDAETMKEVNAEYDMLLKKILSGQSIFGEALEDRLVLEKELREAIAKVSGIEDIIIEICGSWVWLTGETKTHKEAIKSVGYKWSGNKLAWYFHTGGYKRKGKRSYSLDEIRNTHGSIQINKSNYRSKYIGV
jgi:curved DNA-binding protein CbpA